MLFLKRKDSISNTKSDSTIDESTQNFDGQIQVAVDQLKGIVEQMKIATMSLEEISASSKEKTTSLLKHSNQTANNSSLVSKKMLNIESSALHISAFSQEILSNTQSSSDELLFTFESFESLQNKFTTLSDGHGTLLQQMNQLVQNSKNIHDIVHTIGSISQQTRILALNASIEAARAGEHGKGFAVVANEVGNLANQTSVAVDETRKNIELLLDEIRKLTNLVELETKQIEEGETELNQVLNYLQSFKGKLTTITQMVSESTEAVDEQRDSIQEIAQLLQEISQLALKNKENVLQVTEDINKQYENVDDIRIISNSLINTSEELQKIVHQDSTHHAYTVDQFLLENIKQTLSSSIITKQLFSMDSVEHKQILDSILNTHSQLEAIWSNHLNGKFVYSNPPAGLVNAKIRPWFIHASKGEIYVSDIYISALTKKNCITLSMPIVDTGNVIGVIGVDLSID